MPKSLSISLNLSFFKFLNANVQSVGKWTFVTIRPESRELVVELNQKPVLLLLLFTLISNLDLLLFLPVPTPTMKRTFSHEINSLE